MPLNFSMHFFRCWTEMVSSLQYFPVYQYQVWNSSIMPALPITLGVWMIFLVMDAQVSSWADNRDNTANQQT